MKPENQILQDFYEELENHTYNGKEVRQYARAVKFFVTEAQVKFAFNKALKELHKTFNYIYKQHYKTKLNAQKSTTPKKAGHNTRLKKERVLDKK